MIMTWHRHIQLFGTMFAVDALFEPLTFALNRGSVYITISPQKNMSYMDISDLIHSIMISLGQV